MPFVMIVSGVFGAVAGSFLNVCIHRLPRSESIVWPGSHCPTCNERIPWRHNLPLLSYLLLRGRCRSCGAQISPRYPLVEALGAGAALAVVGFHGPTPLALAQFAFLCALIVVTFIDLDHQIIPDRVSLPGIVVGFAASFLPGAPTWQESLIGILIGGGSLWLVAEGYYRLTGREGMGGGDIKLLAMIGAFLGWRGVPVTLMLSSLVGSLIGGLLILARGRDTRLPIPFGPFLAGGAACALFFGDPLIDWYLGLLAPIP